MNGMASRSSSRATSSSAQPTPEELVARFGVSRDKVRYALERVKKRHERLLRQEVRDQVGSEAEIEQELRELL